MSTASPGTHCPHCGSEVAIERGGETRLPGGLYAHEFEILVRNEWRRRLGRDAYDRAHEARLVRTLTSIAVRKGSADLAPELEDEIDQVVADLSATGRGRAAVRREVLGLLHAMRHVLDRSGVDPTSIATFLASARGALDDALGYPEDRRGADPADLSPEEAQP